MIESQNKVRLGELLVDSSVVSSSDLTEAIQVSTRLNIPIGRVLLLSGLVSPVTLEAALEAQPLINDERETKESVLKALSEVDTTGKSLDKLLPGNEYKSAPVSTDKLAGLLLDSEIVSQDELDQALSTSFEEGVPLGSALVMEGILSPSLFPSILKIQQDIRDGAISKNEAIEQVKSTFVHWLKAEESLSSQGLRKEFTPTSSQTRSQKLDNPVIDSPRKTMTKSVDTQIPISITFEPKPNNTPRSLIDLLKDAGQVNDSAIQQSINDCFNDPQKTAKLLEVLGLIETDTKKKALKCHNLLAKGQLSKQEAIYVLSSDLDEELEETSPDKEEKLKRYFDNDHRKSMITKMVGGMVVGVAVAGLSIFKGKSK